MTNAIHKSDNIMISLIIEETLEARWQVLLRSNISIPARKPVQDRFKKLFNKTVL
jgi:hypothetical protein